jgi:cyclophilin family peptidyl-prolyl cis-trans isomerase
VFGRVIDGFSVVKTIERVATGSQADFFDVPKDPITILSIRRLP